MPGRAPGLVPTRGGPCNQEAGEHVAGPGTRQRRQAWVAEATCPHGPGRPGPPTSREVTSLTPTITITLAVGAVVLLAYGIIFLFA
jgi:hypothetical protein